MSLQLFFAATEGSGPPSPETCSPFPSIITFSWFDSLATLGFKRALTTSDLWQLNPRDQSATVAPIFNKNWQPMMQAAHLESREVPEARLALIPSYPISLFSNLNLPSAFLPMEMGKLRLSQIEAALPKKTFRYSVHSSLALASASSWAAASSSYTTSPSSSPRFS